MRSFRSIAYVSLFVFGLFLSGASAQQVSTSSKVCKAGSSFPLLVQTYVQGGTIGPHVFSAIEFNVRSNDVIAGFPSSTPLPGINTISVEGIINLDSTHSLTDDAQSIAVLDATGHAVSTGGTCLNFPPFGISCQSVFRLSEVNVVAGTSSEMTGQMRLRITKNNGSIVDVPFTLN